MERPCLNKVDVEETLQSFLDGKVKKLATMSPRQWDTLLDEAYSLGWTMLEIEGDRVVGAYRRPEHDS